MTLFSLAIGTLLGALGAALHLAVTHWRARRAARSGFLFALVTYPLGLAMLGALVYLASRIAPAAAWSTLIGIFALRAVALHRLVPPAVSAGGTHESVS